MAYAEMILASGDVGIRALMKLCHRMLDGNGMPEDWAMCGDSYLKGKSRYYELWHVWWCKTTRTCNENCRNGTFEMIEKNCND